MNVFSKISPANTPIKVGAVRSALFLIRVYQYGVSPFLGPCCRFYPTCSEYSYQAIARHGILRGGYLSLRRILRCHPFHPGGCDPVP